MERTSKEKHIKTLQTKEFVIKWLGEVMNMLEKLKKTFLNRKFITFGLIGAFNTILAQVLYMLFVQYMNIGVGTASLLGDIIPMFFSYFLNMHFTYHEKPSWKSAVSFPLSYLPGITINFLITVLVNALGVPKIFAKAVSLPIAVPVNFLCMSFIVDKTKRKQEDAA